MASFKGYSLWMTPTEETVHTTLSSAISTTSQLANTPAFPPHMTLLGGLTPPAMDEEELKATTASLAASLSPYTATTTHVDTLPDSVYRCVFLRVDPTDDVVAAWAAAKSAFAITDGDYDGKYDSYMPHVSLVYSDMDPDARAQTAATIASSLDNISFTCSSIQLWDTSGYYTNWRLLGEYPLSAAQ